MSETIDGLVDGLRENGVNSGIVSSEVSEMIGSAQDRRLLVEGRG